MELGGQLDGELGGHTDGDNLEDNHGFRATYPRAFLYMYICSTLIQVIPSLHVLHL